MPPAYTVFLAKFLPLYQTNGRGSKAASAGAAAGPREPFVTVYQGREKRFTVSELQPGICFSVSVSGGRLYDQLAN